MGHKSVVLGWRRGGEGIQHVLDRKIEMKKSNVDVRIYF
jgi:hypothetical protein